MKDRAGRTLSRADRDEIRRMNDEERQGCQAGGGEEGEALMAKDNKVATYRTGKGGEAMTTVTGKQVKQLRDADRLVAVRRVRGVR